MSFTVEQIDPLAEYTAGSLARATGVAYGTARRWLEARGVTPLPRPLMQRRYSGAMIRAAFAAEGHGAPAVKDERAALLRTR